MHTATADIIVLGGGGAGLRAAIAAAELNPGLEIALVSKVVPMRSHTVVAEGGSAGVIRPDDSLDNHFDDTVSGGDWLCEQDPNLRLHRRHTTKTCSMPGHARILIATFHVSSMAT